jgi:hypothetical protein
MCLRRFIGTIHNRIGLVSRTRNNKQHLDAVCVRANNESGNKICNLTLVLLVFACHKYIHEEVFWGLVCSVLPKNCTEETVKSNSKNFLT